MKFVCLDCALSGFSVRSSPRLQCTSFIIFNLHIRSFPWWSSHLLSRPSSFLINESSPHFPDNFHLPFLRPITSSLQPATQTAERLLSSHARLKRFHPRSELHHLAQIRRRSKKAPCSERPHQTETRFQFSFDGISRELGRICAAPSRAHITSSRSGRHGPNWRLRGNSFALSNGEQSAWCSVGEPVIACYGS